MPKVPYGKVPDKEFSTGDSPFNSTRLGILTRVDEHHLKADVRIMGSDERFELDLTQAMCGPRSFLGGIPEVNSLVIIGYRRRSKQIYDAVILGYVPVGSLAGLRYDPFSPVPSSEVDPADAADLAKLYGPTIRYKRIRGKQGDIVGMSASGAEFQLSKDVRLMNRAGDSLELRDVDRTLVSQAINQVASDSAAYVFSGAVRRGAMNLPSWIFRTDKDGNPTKTLKDSSERYFGREELAAAGVQGSTFSNTSGVVLDRINDSNEFPPTTYTNGRQVFVPSEAPAVDFEDALNGGPLRAFTERRMEIRHDTELRQEVLDEVDGFSMDRPRAYIEQVFGTVVGNDAFSTQGQRQYARVLKPKLFEDFDQTASPAGFRLEECLRPPSTAVDEALTMAGGYLFRLLPPRSASRSEFAMAVSKQGKLFVNMPGSTVENYSSKNVSAEINSEGAIKMRVGASTPDRVSLHLTLEGGLFLDVGPNADGQCITTNFRGAIKNVYRGNGNSTDDVAHSMDVQGNAETAISGNLTEVVNGAYQMTVDGGHSSQASTVSINALNSFTGNYGSKNEVISGKSQAMYAQLITETIATGGRTTTVLLGNIAETLVAGARTTTVTAGATSFNNVAGAWSVTVGTGAISMSTTAGAVSLSTAAGAMSLSAASGAISLTAGLAINMVASVAISLTAPQILLGGAAAVLGVARGLPMQPPGSPSLDWITGLPLQGCATVRSI